MMMQRVMLRLTSALVVTTGLTGLGQETKTQQITDQEFVTKAASSGLSEVKLGTMASQRANSTELRQFAGKMVADHTRANDELKALAGRRQLAMPVQMTARDQEDQARLERLQGIEFEHAYARQQLEAHIEAVTLFERESAGGQDADLKAFATQTLPILKQHLQMIRGLTGENR
jgi:putative membrane protein